MLAASAYSSSTDSGAAVAVLVVLGLLALIPASVAGNKGYNRVGFYIFGFFFFIIALIVALLIQDKTKQVAAHQAAGTSTIIWTHTGTRYLAGYTLESPYYGIWDRNQPGPPVMKYPYSEHGKAEALERFKQLEPSGQPIVTGSLPPPPPPTHASEATSDPWAAGPR